MFGSIGIYIYIWRNLGLIFSSTLRFSPENQPLCHGIHHLGSSSICWDPPINHHPVGWNYTLSIYQKHVENPRGFLKRIWIYKSRIFHIYMLASPSWNYPSESLVFPLPIYHVTIVEISANQANQQTHTENPCVMNSQSKVTLIVWELLSDA